jgi:hypothetical protein
MLDNRAIRNFITYLLFVDTHPTMIIHRLDDVCHHRNIPAIEIY